MTILVLECPKVCYDVLCVMHIYPSFTLYLRCILDFSHSKGVADLRPRRNNSIIVVEKLGYLSDTDIDDGEEAVEMEECVATYRGAYYKDLTARLGLGKKVLPPAYAIGTLLNPLFGLEPLIVGAGLMTEDQYRNARKALLKRIQDILEYRQPTYVFGRK